MNGMRRLGLLVIALLAACTAGQPQAPNSSTITSSASPLRTGSPHASEAPPILPGLPTDLERTRYSIDATYDFNAHTLSASQSIRYVNQSDIDLNQLILRSFAHNYGADLQITGLKRADGGLVDSFEDGEGRWSMHLFDPLPPNHDVNLQVTFTLSLPNANGPLGWNAPQTNFIDWYPFIPPFFHSGFYEYTDREPALVGEYQVYESADFDVHLEIINAPSTLTVAAAIDQCTAICLVCQQHVFPVELGTEWRPSFDIFLRRPTRCCRSVVGSRSTGVGNLCRLIWPLPISKFVHRGSHLS
jgi:hypothetical protein